MSQSHQCSGIPYFDFASGIGQIDRSYLGEIRLARRATRLLIEFEDGAVIEMTPEQEAEFWKQVEEVAPYNIYAHNPTKTKA
jgi:hypothetical protein